LNSLEDRSWVELPDTGEVGRGSFNNNTHAFQEEERSCDQREQMSQQAEKEKCQAQEQKEGWWERFQALAWFVGQTFELSNGTRHIWSMSNPQTWRFD